MMGTHEKLEGLLQEMPRSTCMSVVSAKGFAEIHVQDAEQFRHIVNHEHDNSCMPVHAMTISMATISNYHNKQLRQ